MAKSTERKTNTRATDADVSERQARRPRARATAAPVQNGGTEPIAGPAEDGADEGAAPSELEIARLAHERYAARGRVDGYDMEDWLEAELELCRDQVTSRRRR